MGDNLKEKIYFSYKPNLNGRNKKGLVLLDFNERTTEPNKRVKSILKKTVDSKTLQLYPEQGEINKEIAKYASVKESQIITTNGSCQAIDIIMRFFLKQKDGVVIPAPNFPMIYQYAEILGAKIFKPAYQIGEKKFLFPFRQILRLMNKNLKLVVIVNPNNPTGTIVAKNELLEILKKAKKNNIAILSDEAYFEFSHVTAKDLIGKYSNLYITRTFSKAFGLASLRLGYIISQEKNIKELSRFVSPYDVNAFAKKAGIAALGELDYMKSYVKEVMSKSKIILEKFFYDNKIDFYFSAANFLLIKPYNKEEVLKILHKEGVLVRTIEEKGFNDLIRVTVGTVNDTRRFIKAYSKILA